ncbi:hypothetical protein ECJB195_4683 [Escherichia coli JB1-95]|nr:hypothetical protein ECJB195_4683 [Escherichia coli JB1-95]
MVVYPRWRGELDRTASVVSSGSGLSPLARGALREEYLQHPQERFIPAGAGNTVTACTRCNGSPVYPRWRGEHTLSGRYYAQISGLSPLARGTPAG